MILSAITPTLYDGICAPFKAEWKNKDVQICHRLMKIILGKDLVIFFFFPHYLVGKFFPVVLGTYSRITPSCVKDFLR